MNPDMARSTQLGLNRGMRKELHKNIDNYVVECIKAREIRDRASLVTALESAGLRVTKQSKQFITVIDPSDRTMKKGMRLKGEMYAQDFDSIKWIKKGLSAEATSAANRERQSIDELAANVEKAVRTRIEYNAKRHPSPQSQAVKSNQNEAAGLNIDADFLPSQLRDDMPSNLDDNQAPTSPRHTSAERLPSHTNQPKNHVEMQPKRVANRPEQQHLTSSEMTAEAILRLIEKLAKLFGINANVGSYKNDRNRTEFNELAQSARATNARVSNALRTAKQYRNNQDTNVIESSRSIEQIERDTIESNTIAKQTISEFGQTVKSIGYAIKERLEQQQQQQNNNGNMEYK